MPEDPIATKEPLFIPYEDEIRDIHELEDFSRKSQKYIVELLKDRPTNQEMDGAIDPLAIRECTEIIELFQEHYDEKYQNLAETEGFDIPKLYIPSLDNDLGSDRKAFQEIAEKARDIYLVLKTPFALTSTANFNSTIFEAYQRVKKDSPLAQDIRKLYFLTGFGLTVFDRSDVLTESLIDSPQSPKDYLAVITMLLLYEAAAKKSGEGIIQISSEALERIKTYMHANGFDNVPFPEIEDIVFARNMESINPTGPIFEREYKRGKPGAIINLEDNLEDGRAYFVVESPKYWENMDEGDQSYQVLDFTHKIIHEWIHFYGKGSDHMASGTWEEAARELITDASTLEITNAVGIWHLGKENEYDWTYKTGYHYLMRLKLTLDTFGLMSPDEYIHLGMTQDFRGFVNLVDERLGSLGEKTKKDIIMELDRRIAIGPDQFDQLMSGGGNLTTEQLIRACLEFLIDVPSRDFLLISIADSSPRYKGIGYGQFLEQFMSTPTDRDNEAKRNIRHQEIRDYISWRQNKPI